MSKITVKNIKPAGSELFADSESFMNELSKDELSNVLGGVQANLAASVSLYSFFNCANTN